jgi:hypothetical protein
VSFGYSSDNGIGGTQGGASPFPSGSGHDAGWQWAIAQGLTADSVVDGGGSFRDGARAYVDSLKKTDES